ncbi:MAG: hypothetical protein QOJ26_793 [Thermoplasmata archaeon]|nr:hypothetical protein [Thermoplasmata archaeon]
MRGASLLLVAITASALLAGCLDDGADADDQAAADDEAARIARGVEAESNGAPGPETLYLWREDEDRLKPEPSDYPFEGWGFAEGGSECGPTRAICWGTTYVGPTSWAHHAGDPVHVLVWINGAMTPPPDAVLDVWLEADGGTLAEGHAAPVQPLPGTPAPGAEGCVLATVDLTLPGELAAGVEVGLGLRVDGLFGNDCFGGGTEGSRVVFDTALEAAPAGSGAPGSTS